MSHHNTLAIGIDVGGTKIAAGLVERETGVVLTRRLLPTRAERGGMTVLDDCVALAEALAGEAEGRGGRVSGIGVGVCELVDAAGNVTSAHTVDWRGLPVRERLAQIAPAVVEADVRAHALAEARYGAGHGYRDFVFVTVGTGISSCLVLGGRPYPGVRGNALVVASSPLTNTCAVCGTVNAPVVEEIAGGPGLVAGYNRRAGADLTRAEQVLAAAERGDVTAAEVVREGARLLGVTLGWLVNTLDPEALIVGGGLGSAAGMYWEALVAATRAHIWADAGRSLPITQTALGADAGIIGAAAGVAP